MGINAAGFGFSVEEVVDYFPMVKWVDGEVKRNQSPGRDRSSRWCTIWEVGSRGRFLASATMIVFLNVMKTTLPSENFPYPAAPGGENGVHHRLKGFALLYRNLRVIHPADH